jgi:lipid A ethanolaminephosphotransferase
VDEQHETGGTPVAPVARRHWNPTTPRFILAASLLNATLYHVPLYSFGAANLDLSSATGALTLATLFVLVTLVSALIVGLVSLASERLVKPLSMVVAVANSVAVYFVHAYGVVLDKAMMGNVFNTNVAEASALFHPKILLYVLFLGILPALVAAQVTVRRTPFLRRLAFVCIVLTVGVSWGYANSTSWLWIDRNSKRLGGMTMPWSYVINGPIYLASLAKTREQKLLPPAAFISSGKTVVMLVIDEAARAQNFSLYGYSRSTNPVLSKAGVVVLPHTRSCTTYTTASLTCILSHVAPNVMTSWEPLTSYLQRSGVDVIWRTNNTGEPPMTVQTFERADALRPDCHGDGCAHDGVLLQGLEQRIRASAQDHIFVVLHFGGSHGPAYYSKYPPRFETFRPVCRSVDMSQCTNDELINAYDNTIVYADYLVGQAIELLKGLAPMPAMLMFLSDHGESLGEYNLYLHGTPFTIAPDVQKDIPFLVWMSDAFKQRKGIPAAQLARGARHSQANLFHSVMDAFDMRSEIFNPDLDIFASGAPAE